MLEGAGMRLSSLQTVTSNTADAGEDNQNGNHNHAQHGSSGKNSSGNQSFANKRKGIKNNLKKLEINYEKLRINPLARAEELSIEDFIAVFQSIDI